MINLLSPLAYRTLTWKNGGGSTTEIAVDPEGAGWDAFNWRVAIADINKSGPFSQFPGVDRSIVLLDSARDSEMKLTIAGKAQRMQPRVFVDFPGEAETSGDLFGAPVRDFNIMSRRGVVRHRRGWHSLSPNALYRMGGSDRRIIYVVSGTADLVTTAAARSVGAGESLVAIGDDTLVVRGGPMGAQLVWVVFSVVA